MTHRLGTGPVVMTEDLRRDRSGGSLETKCHMLQCCGFRSCALALLGSFSLLRPTMDLSLAEAG